MKSFVPYGEIEPTWPAEGRHVLATWDAESVVVYQAYRPSIGRFAAEHGYFGGEFSLDRMSWVKTNFLWMMYRSGWGTKADQEITLAVRLRRDAFDAILAAAVPSSAKGARCEVRVQWDPDHDPHGRPLARRAVQLGLRGSFLARYAREWILDVEDISALVAAQRANVGTRDLLVPSESVYPFTPEPRVGTG